MSKKDFKLARKPGEGNGAMTAAPPQQPPPAAVPASVTRARKSEPVPTAVVDTAANPTTRKTIEVPEDYFRRVKIRAVERGMLEKELWAEILGEYFKSHPL